MVACSFSEETLQDLLQQMDATCRKLEDVVLDEQKAVRMFDPSALIELTDIRHACQQQLQGLEAACRDIMRQYDVPDELSLETFIDAYLPDVAPGLQSLRRELCQRLVGLTHASEENRIRLRATYEVTTGVLEGIGALEKKATYGPGGAL